MTRRSRFAIEESLLGDHAEASDLSASGRLGPMATAIREAARANERAEGDVEYDELATLELAANMRELRDADLDLRLVDVDKIDAEYLRRDRQEVAEEGLEELVVSIRENGLSTPIRLEVTDDGRFLLNQGKRRLEAFRRLREVDADRFARIPALVQKQGGRDRAYRKMVDENLVREDVSFAELAALAMAYADEFSISHEQAVKDLFGSLQKARRWSIGEFVKVLAAIGPHLAHPKALKRDFGIAIARKLTEPSFAQAVRTRLDELGDRDEAEEAQALADLVRGEGAAKRSRTTERVSVRKFRVGGRGVGGKRYDVSVSPKKIVISGTALDQVDEVKLRAFLESLS